MNLIRSIFLRCVALLTVAALGGAGCTDFSKPPEQLGHLIVTVRDETGKGVPGINFTALLSDRATEWAKVSTSGDGTAEFRASDGGILPQTYIVRFDALNGSYRLAADESNDKPVVVVIGQTQTVNFKVTKAGPSGP